MKVQICSDLHLEFSQNRKWLKANPIEPLGDILIIAGDTYYLGRTWSKLDFIKKASREFQQVFIIPGNHEYYEGFDLSTALSSTHEKIMDNVFLVNDQSIMIEGIRFIFSTFWTIIQRHMLEIMRGMADFHRIKFHGEKLTVPAYNQLHEKAAD